MAGQFLQALVDQVACAAHVAVLVGQLAPEET